MEREACRGSLRCNTGSRQAMLLRRPCICLLTTCSILPTNLCEVWVADFCFVLHKQYGNKIEAIRIRTWPVTLYTGGGVFHRFSYLQSWSGLATLNPSRDEVRSAMPLSTAKTQDINLSLCQAQTELCTWEKKDWFHWKSDFLMPHREAQESPQNLSETGSWGFHTERSVWAQQNRYPWSLLSSEASMASHCLRGCESHCEDRRLPVSSVLDVLQGSWMEPSRDMGAHLYINTMRDNVF